MGFRRNSSKTPWGAIASLLVALLYGASPIDLIPDVLPIVGWIDDAILVPLLLILAYVQWKRSRKLRQTA